MKLKSFWHEWRGSHDGRPSMFIRNLISFRGFKLDLHKFVRADDPTCFHTHPAKAIRLILWGGYWEECQWPEPLPPDWTVLVQNHWRPGDVGIVRPELCHRIHQITNGRSSYSLWLRWPKSAEIHIQGDC